MWWYNYSNADVVMRYLSFKSDCDGDDNDDDNGDNDDNDWRRRLWWWNAWLSIVLIINREDFEQAYTVGH